MRRWSGTLSIGAMLTIAAVPFVLLFPEPPAFGRGAATVVAVLAILAIMGTAFRAAPVQRAGIARRAAAGLAVTVSAVGLRILIAGHAASVPTLDVLPKMFALQGEDVDDAVLYEVWLETWLACAAVGLGAIGLRRAMRRSNATTLAAPPPRDAPVRHPKSGQRWNAATILLFVIGLAAVGGAMLEGHWTAAFLSGSDHVIGTVADPQPHPLIRFKASDGVVVQFTQNGFVSRPLGAEVPVAYQAQDPAGTAQADTIWANWSDVAGLLWIGFGFTLAPFFGFRAEFRAGRW